MVVVELAPSIGRRATMYSGGGRVVRFFNWVGGAGVNWVGGSVAASVDVSGCMHVCLKDFMCL